MPLMMLSSEQSSRWSGPIMIVPLSTVLRPVRREAMVDLPLPLSPTIPVKLFCGICMVTLRSTSRSPS